MILKLLLVSRSLEDHFVHSVLTRDKLLLLAE